MYYLGSTQSALRIASWMYAAGIGDSDELRQKVQALYSKELEYPKEKERAWVPARSQPQPARQTGTVETQSDNNH